MANEEMSVESVLHVGNTVVLNLGSSGREGVRHRSVLRGWTKPVEIVLDRPKDAGRYVPLYGKEPCVALFVAEGKACAFETHVLNWDNWGHSCRLRVAWPRGIKAVSFRKFERSEVCIDCTVSQGGKPDVKGVIQDISLGGCGIVLPVEARKNTPVTLSFTLSDGHSLERVKAVVRNARRVGEEIFIIGFEFAQKQEDARNEIEFFIASMFGDDEAQDRGAGRVMIIDDNSERAAPLWQALTARGCEAYLASNAVDGLARLRLVGARALVINQEQQDLDPVAIVRLLHASHGLETLPVFVYGGKEAELGKKAEEVGIAGYFASPKMTDAICDAIEKATSASTDGEDQEGV